MQNNGGIRVPFALRQESIDFDDAIQNLRRSAKLGKMHWSSLVAILREAVSFRGILQIVDKINIFDRSKVHTDENVRISIGELDRTQKENESL